MRPIGVWPSILRGLPRGARRTVFFAVVQIAMIWATTAIILGWSYREDMRTWRATSLSTSLSSAAFVRQSLNAADLVLRSMVDWVVQEEIDTEEEFVRVMSSDKYRTALRDRIIATPQINAAVIAARSGQVVNANSANDASPRSIASRESFRSQMAADPPPLTLTTLARNPVSGRWTFYMAMRATSPAGVPVGVMVVGLDSDYFSSLFRGMTIGGEEAITLFRSDGTVLATSLRDEKLLGQKFPDAPPILMVRQGQSGTVGRVEGPRWNDSADGSARLLAPRLVEGFPVVISVAVNERTYLANWHQDALRGVLIAAVLTLLTGVAAYRMVCLLGDNDRALRVAAERRLLQALLDTPSALCALLDRSGRSIYANARFRDCLAGSEPAAILDDPHLKGAALVRDFATADTPETLDVDLRLERPGAAPRFLRFTLARQSLPDYGRCTVLIGQDETSRHEAQNAIAQSAKLVTLGELTTGMAHELSQPLNVMRMAAQNALMEVAPADGGTARPDDPTTMADAEFRKFAGAKFKRIVAQVDRAADIVSRMRIFGRAPQGPARIYDAREACRTACVLVGARLTALGITFRQQLGEEPLLTTGYQNLIEQVLVNLLLNARDALKDRRSCKEIVVRAGRGENGRVVLQVSDTGPGVAADIRDRIFEPFFTAKPLGEGTGLGLALSFGIVKDAGGELSLLPGGEGATFQIELPAAE